MINFRKTGPLNSYFWKWIHSVGKSGGILYGVQFDSLEVQIVKFGEHMILINLWDEEENCKWDFIYIHVWSRS
jgi:hypothetical protein